MRAPDRRGPVTVPLSGAATMERKESTQETDGGTRVGGKEGTNENDRDGGRLEN